MAWVHTTPPDESVGHCPKQQSLRSPVQGRRSKHSQGPGPGRAGLGAVGEERRREGRFSPLGPASSPPRAGRARRAAGPSDRASRVEAGGVIGVETARALAAAARIVPAESGLPTRLALVVRVDADDDEIPTLGTAGFTALATLLAAFAFLLIATTAPAPYPPRPPREGAGRRAHLGAGANSASGLRRSVWIPASPLRGHRSQPRRGSAASAHPAVAPASPHPESVLGSV